MQCEYATVGQLDDFPRSRDRRLDQWLLLGRVRNRRWQVARASTMPEGFIRVAVQGMRGQETGSQPDSPQTGYADIRFQNGRGVCRLLDACPPHYGRMIPWPCTMYNV